MERTIGGTRIEIAQGDITQERVDAIVNAANATLRGGGGVDGAIHRAGGPAILEECARIGGCDTGDARITTGGNLPARHVIHTVGPVYRDGLHDEPALLASCYRRSLELARQHGLLTVAFPAISCGAYGYPLKDAAKIAVETVADYIVRQGGLDRVRFVLFSPEVYQAFVEAMDGLPRGADA